MRRLNMSKTLRFAFIAAVLAMISGMSSPVLAAYPELGAYYDSPSFTGGGSDGYNAYQRWDSD
jgi:hypothetical protein